MSIKEDTRTLAKWLNEEQTGPIDRQALYDDFKIDEPVMVSLDNKAWYRRHFAGVSADGRPQTWSDGRTSFTVAPGHCGVTTWDECRRPTPEELRGE